MTLELFKQINGNGHATLIKEQNNEIKEFVSKTLNLKLVDFFIFIKKKITLSITMKSGLFRLSEEEIVSILFRITPKTAKGVMMNK